MLFQFSAVQSAAEPDTRSPSKEASHQESLVLSLLPSHFSSPPALSIPLRPFEDLYATERTRFISWSRTQAGSISADSTGVLLLAFILSTSLGCRLRARCHDAPKILAHVRTSPRKPATCAPRLKPAVDSSSRALDQSKWRRVPRLLCRLSSPSLCHCWWCNCFSPRWIWAPLLLLRRCFQSEMSRRRMFPWNLDR